MSKFSDEERAAIMETARRNIAARPAIERDLARRLMEAPVEDPVAKYRREADELEASRERARRVEERSQPERELRHSQPIEREPASDWSAWNRWCDQRIQTALEAEREFL